MRDVQARTGQFGDLDVTSDTDRFGRRRHPGQAQARRSDAFTHDRARSERNIFGVLDYRDIEGTAVIHNLASEFCGGDGLAVIRNRDDSGIAHRGDIRDGFALATDAGGTDGPDAHVAKSFGTIDDEAGGWSV